MGIITECYEQLSEYLLREHQSSKGHSRDADLIRTKVLSPVLPRSVRCAAGIVTDIKDRHVGPFDAVGSLDEFPMFGDGAGATFLANGALFALQIRNWAENDLTQFGVTAANLKMLDRTPQRPLPCLAVSFDPLPLPELIQFLKSKPAEAVDGVFCVGHHFILRNSDGWYGDPIKVPYVTERPGPEALKAFSMYMIHLCQSALGVPFGLAAYQHL